VVLISTCTTSQATQQQQSSQDLAMGSSNIARAVPAIMTLLVLILLSSGKFRKSDAWFGLCSD